MVSFILILMGVVGISIQIVNTPPERRKILSNIWQNIFTVFYSLFAIILNSMYLFRLLTSEGQITRGVIFQICLFTMVLFAMFLGIIYRFLVKPKRTTNK